MNKYLNVLVGILEVFIFFILINVITETVAFNACMFILTFAGGFAIGINKSKFKYLYPLIISYVFMLGISFPVELLFIQYLVFGYIGLFISTFINLFRGKKHLKHASKVSLATLSIIILTILFVCTNA